MRIGCSQLNGDLCNNLHVIEHPNCDCGHPLENAHHYLLDCPLYVIQRLILMTEISSLTNIVSEILLFGDKRLTVHENQRVFDAVHKFILNTNRFT